MQILVFLFDHMIVFHFQGVFLMPRQSINYQIKSKMSNPAILLPPKFQKYENNITTKKKKKKQAQRNHDINYQYVIDMDQTQTPMCFNGNEDILKFAVGIVDNVDCFHFEKAALCGGMNTVQIIQQQNSSKLTEKKIETVLTNWLSELPVKLGWIQEFTKIILQY
ncbi:hypothetical protein RFI_11909, partial [Reticulomyxa filosa]